MNSSDFINSYSFFRVAFWFLQTFFISQNFPLFYTHDMSCLFSTKRGPYLYSRYHPFHWLRWFRHEKVSDKDTFAFWYLFIGYIGNDDDWLEKLSICLLEREFWCKWFCPLSAKVEGAEQHRLRRFRQWILKEIIQFVVGVITHPSEIIFRFNHRKTKRNIT